MSETTVKLMGRIFWTPEAMEKDLNATGLLEGMFFLIHKEVKGWNRYTGLCGGGNLMYVTWIADKLLIIGMQTYHQVMIDAFASVLEYKPFCRYQYLSDENKWILVSEWSKEDPSARIEQIQSDERVKDFKLLDSE